MSFKKTLPQLRRTGSVLPNRSAHSVEGMLCVFQAHEILLFVLRYFLTKPIQFKGRNVLRLTILSSSSRFNAR